MAKEDHPAFYLSCCTPWLRGPTPSGRMERVHRFNCPVSPNEVIDPVVPRPASRRAELANHAARPHDWRTCRLPDCEACDYTEAWMDEAYEQEGRR